MNTLIPTLRMYPSYNYPKSLFEKQLDQKHNGILTPSARESLLGTQSVPKIQDQQQS